MVIKIIIYKGWWTMEYDLDDNDGLIRFLNELFQNKELANSK